MNTFQRQMPDLDSMMPFVGEYASSVSHQDLPPLNLYHNP